MRPWRRRLPASHFVLGLDFVARLPRFLRWPVTPAGARARVAERLARREADLLALARVIYTRDENPYARLLRAAGCEYGDLVGLVRRDGVEGALRTLLHQGVYLTGDELKGRVPVIRHGLTFTADAALLRNPRARPHLPMQSSGRRGVPTHLGWDLRYVGDRAVNLSLIERVRESGRSRYALWGVLGSAGLTHLLELAHLGAPPVRWFSQLDPRAPELDPWYWRSASLVSRVSRAVGVPIPLPVHVPIDAPLPIARWLSQVLSEGDTPHLIGFPSSMVRLCEQAREAGVSLAGARFSAGGEPLTERRLATIREAGGDVVARYSSAEAGLMAHSCLEAAAPDDYHVLHDLIALAQPTVDEERPGLPGDALLVTALRPTAPMLLLNASTGDRGVLARRACECPLDRLGWTRHLTGLWSFEKLTSAGMMVLDGHVVRILEERLPARFGGGPADYQLLEEEDTRGGARLRLLVHPRVGPLDPAAVIAAFLDAVGPGNRAERVTALVWREAGTVTVERRPPLTTDTGKVLHVHHEPARLGSALGSPGSS